MRNVLSISDSVEGTRFFVGSSIKTIKDYQMEPYVVVPEYRSEDGSIEETDVKGSLEFCFSQCEPDAIAIGYIPEARILNSIQQLLLSRDHNVIVFAPSIISDNGELMMDEDAYNALVGGFISGVQLVVLNVFEAELLAEFECPEASDIENACKKIFETYGCLSYVRGDERVGGKDFLFTGMNTIWMDKITPASGFDVNSVSFIDSIVCELSNEVGIEEAIRNARRYAYGLPIEEEKAPIVAPSSLSSATVSSPSLISPAKSLRDIARSMDTTPQMPKINIPGVTNTKQAVTSTIEKPLPSGPKGTVSEIKEPERAPKAIEESLSELQELRDRLKKLSQM